VHTEVYLPRASLNAHTSRLKAHDTGYGSYTAGTTPPVIRLRSRTTPLALRAKLGRSKPFASYHCSNLLPHRSSGPQTNTLKRMQNLHLAAHQKYMGNSNDKIVHASKQLSTRGTADKAPRSHLDQRSQKFFDHAPLYELK
jgi:hypothetical protein